MWDGIVDEITRAVLSKMGIFDISLSTLEILVCPLVVGKAHVEIEFYRRNIRRRMSLCLESTLFEYV